MMRRMTRRIQDEYKLQTHSYTHTTHNIEQYNNDEDTKIHIFII